MVGQSMPCRWARWCALRDVSTPSATAPCKQMGAHNSRRMLRSNHTYQPTNHSSTSRSCRPPHPTHTPTPPLLRLTPMVVVMSSSFSPLPSRRPTVRLRDRSPVQAAGRSGGQAGRQKLLNPEPLAGSEGDNMHTGMPLLPIIRLTQHNVAHARQARQRQRVGAQAHCRGWGWVGLGRWRHPAARPLAPGTSSTPLHPSHAPARRVISSRPRVMSAARPLEPKPRPSEMPQAAGKKRKKMDSRTVFSVLREGQAVNKQPWGCTASQRGLLPLPLHSSQTASSSPMASTFFSAPPSSTPVTSLVR